MTVIHFPTRRPVGTVIHNPADKPSIQTPYGPDHILASIVTEGTERLRPLAPADRTDPDYQIQILIEMAFTLGSDALAGHFRTLRDAQARYGTLTPDQVQIAMLRLTEAVALVTSGGHRPPYVDDIRNTR